LSEVAQTNLVDVLVTCTLHGDSRSASFWTAHPTLERLMLSTNLIGTLMTSNTKHPSPLNKNMMRTSLVVPSLKLSTTSIVKKKLLAEVRIP